jgi:AcrR family transcriptional regulator
LLDHAETMLEADEVEPGIRALARAAGVSAMAPYRHFADKAALLDAVAERGFALLAARLAEADARGSDPERLVAQGLAYVALARERPALFRLMFARAAECGPAPEKTRETAPAFTILADRVAKVAGSAAPDATLGCWAIVHGLATLALDSRVDPAPEQLRAVLALYVRGISRPT